MYVIINTLKDVYVKKKLLFKIKKNVRFDKEN